MTSLRAKLMAEDEKLQDSYVENTPKRRLALALRALRKNTKLTQEQIALKSGLRQSQISKMEAPTGPMPTTDSLNRYADACGSDLCLAFPAKGTKQTQLHDDDSFICAVF